MGLLHRSSICVLALVAGSAALQLEPATVRDLAFGDGQHRVTIGAVRTPLWSAAFAQAADSFSLENVSFTFGGAIYEVKRIDLSGVTSSRTDIEALFSSTSTETMMRRLSRIGVKKVTIPEARVKQQFGDEVQTVTYRNIVLSDIVEGRIASLTVEATALEASGKQGAFLIGTGRTTIGDLDMQALASLYETKAGPGSTPLTRIYGTFSVDEVDVTEPKEGLSISVARLSGRDFLARPTKDSWTGTTALLTELSRKEDLTSEENSRLIAIVADIMEAFDIGQVEATAIAIKGQSKKSDGTAMASPTEARIARIAYTGNGKADTRFEGIEIADPNGRVKIDSFSITGFSIAPTLEGLKSLQGKSPEEVDAAAIRRLTPNLGTIRLSGLDIDTLSKEETGQKPERIKASLKAFEFAADKPVNAIPTDLRFNLQNLALALPPDSTDDGVRELLALGYRAIDMSFNVAANWNEAASELALREVSVEGKDMGRLSLTGLLGNVGKDVFHTDTAVATVALMDAKAKSLDLTVKDEGLFGRYLARAAKEQKTTPESLRRTYASATAFVVPAMIGNSDQAKELSKAIARFIAQPGRLTVNAQSRDPSGLGLIDVLMLSDPKDALGKVSITARAE